jgi:hypothetical protein
MTLATARTRAVFAAQRFVLWGADLVLRLRRSADRPTVTWVVGPSEVASMAEHIAAAVPGSFLAVVHRHAFYGREYDVGYRFAADSLRGRIERVFKPAIWLAALTRQAVGFIYLSADGYLISSVDGRSFEFNYLKKRGRGILQVCTGDDVRSQRLMGEVGRRFGVATIAEPYAQMDPYFASDAYDEAKRLVGRVIDEYADDIISLPTDQPAYISRQVEPFRYFYPDEKLSDDFSKFDDTSTIRIVHAPSAPAIKGTSVVRDAISRLHDEGYDFVYRELMGVPNDEVLSALDDSHIALNQFYAFAPGVFGVEAMAHACVMLCSADPSIETALGDEAAGAWVLTRVGEVYDNLKWLLDHPEKLRDQARRGFEWVRDNQTVSTNGSGLRQILERIESGL